jgi:ABC-type multidrug transport system ATPase subunit
LFVVPLNRASDANGEMQLIVIASIHQPSTSTFNLFDKIVLLSGGKTCYFGPILNIEPHFESVGYPLPAHTNPAEFMLDLVNIDFLKDQESANRHIDTLHKAWLSMPEEQASSGKVETGATSQFHSTADDRAIVRSSPREFRIMLTLVHRSFIKSYRDVVAYGIRILMYTGRLTASFPSP